MVANNNSSSGGKGQGSGSDTVSAANISAGTSTGNAGQPQPSPAQSGTLASHTSSPMGGSHGAGAGPEHLRHLDKDAGKGFGGSGGSGMGGSRPGGASGSQSTVSHAGGVSDVGNRAGEMAGEAFDQASGVAREAYQQASSIASDAFDRGSRYYDDAAQRSLEGFGEARRGVERFVAENPMMVGVIGLAAGLVIGALLPRTRQEDRTLGRWADEVRGQGMRYARDMAHRGREMIDETLSGGDDEREDWRQSGGRGGQGGQRSQGGRYQPH